MIEPPESVPGSASSRASDSSTDLELEQALEGFVDWARHEGAGEARELPPLRGFGRPGDRLGDYELVRRLGIGGMGVVFEARQLSVAGRRVAIKLLRSVFVTEALARRFEREVETVAALEHRSIVPLVDARVHGGVPYYVMKYVDGVSAARLVRELRGRTIGAPTGSEVRRFVQELSRERAPTASGASGASDEGSSAWEREHHRWIARIGLQLAEALQFAHEHRVVHRDVKPGNVMITPDGRAVLLDFGLASVEGDESLTRSGQFLGTFRYAAPEQVRGEGTDGRSDVFSLGASLYELLTLRHPFDAPCRVALSAGPGELSRERSGEMPGPAPRAGGERRTGDEVPGALDTHVPADLRTILMHAMAVAPKRRYPSAAALAADLRAFLAHQPIQARPPGLLERTGQIVRRYPRTSSAFLALALMAWTLIGFREWRARRSVQEGLVHLEQGLAAGGRLGELRLRFAAARTSRPGDLRAHNSLHAALIEQRGLVDDLFDQAERALLGAEEDELLGGSANRALARVYAERLRFCLERGADVVEPLRLAPLEEHLRQHDRNGAYAALLDPTGSVELTSDRGARVRVSSGEAGAAPRYAGELPVRLELLEGSYVAEVEANSGERIALPFFVRRDVVREQTRDEARGIEGSVNAGGRSALHVPLDFPPLAEAPSGLRYVAAGAALVERDPAVWQHVEAFYMREFEVTNEELRAWLVTLDELGHSGFASELLGRLSLARLSGKPRAPVRGLTPMEMSGILRFLDQVQPLPEGWMYDLPTRAEYIRAARGADARRYPWGERFSWDSSVNYYSLSSFPGDAVPEPVGHRPRDVSVFGVRDLAGSVAEITSELYGPLPGEFLLFGGSFRSVDAGELALDRRGRLANEPRPDVGFRYVVRALDAWFRQPDRAPERFFDDFERADGTQLGAGWWESTGPPGVLRTRLDEGRGGRLVAGRAICEGGVGNFSESAELWQRIHVGTGDFRVRLRARAGLASGVQDSAQAGRQSALMLAAGPGVGPIADVALRFNTLGQSELQWRTRELQESELATTRFLDPASLSGAASGAEFDYEIRVQGGQIEASISRAGDAPGSGVLLRRGRPNGWQPRYLIVRTPGLIGARLEIDEVLVEPLPPLAARSQPPPGRSEPGFEK